MIEKIDIEKLIRDCWFNTRLVQLLLGITSKVDEIIDVVNELAKDKEKRDNICKGCGREQTVNDGYCQNCLQRIEGWSG